MSGPEFRRCWDYWEARGYPQPFAFSGLSFEDWVVALWAYLDWIASTIEKQRQ